MFVSVNCISLWACAVLLFGDDEKVCTHMFRSLAFITVVGFIVGQCILILRAYAVWGSGFDRLYAVIFSICSGTFAGIFWTSSKYIGGVYSTGVPALGMTGCAIFFKNRLGWVAITLFSVVESISTGLMIIKAIQHFITIANLVVIVIAPVSQLLFIEYFVFNRGPNPLGGNKRIHGRRLHRSKSATHKRQSVYDVCGHAISRNPSMASRVTVHLTTRLSTWVEDWHLLHPTFIYFTPRPIQLSDQCTPE
ncbi:hypothetical protein BD410DRAFT_826498 [Rickenella mellea]|uniref:Uncharacterized protein n=1 Tax=Rickenella mellea TaxID=50990 RepID=A0A4Y7QD73_9AGAM|nr:hypothetical protein BD410DRAFT_826498 [Rickenella mellea]